jgi:long-chain acyl-CoA synthetase
MGRPMITMNVEVVDEHGAPAPAGTVGPLRIGGPGVTTAFAGVVAPGDEGIRDGWYYPGDLGSFDERGLLHLHGRASDLIKRGGLMVYAQEVEQALRRHESVVDAAVVGAPSESLGEEVVAFVVLKAPVEEAALIQHCRRELAPFKVPARITVVDALPRNTSGKVIKAELLKALA